MKNAMQLKAIMKNIAKDKNISAQLVLQNYMMERLLERVSLSEYKDKFIIKGGFLIASLVGLDTRATMDIDATVKGYPVEESTVREMFKKICDIQIEDDITFSFVNIEEIREGDKYKGYRVSITADYPPMSVPLKLDITAGDVITPREINYKYKMMLEDKYIPLLAYNVETILAEKIETIISRSDQNTRPRDYYDVYIIWKLKRDEIDFSKLNKALVATANKRGSQGLLDQYRSIMDVVKSSETMQSFWNKYQKSYTYAKDIAFKDTCEAVVEIMSSLNI
ncbi:MAG: nucleotidyl transferase AbiEii/AbiGii toxin family protein [Oscillospiraceae bacterium]|nr:nucleotidyl transferase AbiEii/AbiGii toxin family protein [Candidatus Limimonas egerieequi]